MKKIMVLTLSLMLVTTLVLSLPIALAGNKNQNGDNGSQGTGRVNGLDGCIAYGGTTAVILGPASPFPPPYPQVSPWVVEGGACCPSNEVDGVTDGGTTYYVPNQCCNPPDMGPVGVPGNHCMCFAIRNYAVVP